MINTQILEHSVKLAIYSTKILNEKPISIILLAPPEHGKTEILTKFAFYDTIELMTDFNTFKFQNFVNEYITDRKRTIMIPDFLKVIKKKYASSANALGILNAIIEEGWMGTLPLGQKIDRLVIANVITALTRDEILDKRHKWSSIGFLSRFLPLTFSYSENTKELVRGYIKDRLYKIDDRQKKDLGVKQEDIILPKEIAEDLERLTIKIMLKFKSLNFTGFRLQKQLQVLAMSSALSNGRNLVTDDDFKVVQTISQFINYDFREI